MSNRNIKVEGAPMGACPLEDPNSSSKQNPPLTLSQKLQKSRADIKQRNTEIITQFIVEHIEPLLEAQAISGLSKTIYMFIPSDTEQKELTELMPQNKNIVEGFGGREKSGPYISKLQTKEYMKVIRLILQEYSLEFWQQPGVMKEINETLRSRLQANGEKLADTSSTRWPQWIFTDDGETLPPGFTGAELKLVSSAFYPSLTFLALYVEIT